MVLISGICEACGNAFSKKLRPNRVSTVAGRSCGHECSHKLLAQQRITGITFNCVGCGKTVFRCQTHFKRSPGRYCSHRCHSAARQVTETRDCSVCGKPVTRLPNQFRFEKVVCSLKCRAQNLSTDSYVEKLFEQQLPSGVKFRRNDRTVIAPLELDFFFPEYAFAVELNGIQHYSAVFGITKFRQQRKNDRRKKEMCGQRGIHLIPIKLGDCTPSTLSRRFAKAFRFLKRKMTA